MSQSQDPPYTVIAAIDLGTATSGYAFAYETNTEEPAQIELNHWHVSDDDRQSTRKIPSHILINEDGFFDCFGHDAKRKYKQLCLKQQNREVFYFRNILKHLYKEDKIQNTIDDETGKPMDAVTVFSYAIRYLQEQLIDALQRDKKHTIRWLIVASKYVSDNTVAKQFIVKAVKEADKTLETNVTIVSESDASVEFFRQSTKNLRQKGDKPRYILVNLGGGLIDVTTTERNENGNIDPLKLGMDDIRKPGMDAIMFTEITGSDFNITFLQFIENLFGTETFSKWKHHSYRAYLEMEDQIEGLKFSNSTFNPLNDETTFFKLPVSLIKMANEKVLEKEIHANGLNFEDGEIEISNSFMRKLFERTIEILGNRISNTFVKGTTAVVLIGGIANSAYIQHRIDEQFSKVVIPENPGLVVLKGAVYFGMENPQTRL